MNVVQSTLLAAAILASSACANHSFHQRPEHDSPETQVAATDPVSDSRSSDGRSDVTQDAAELYGDVDVRDPWERYNRRIYGFNNVVDKYVLRPLAIGYNELVPEVVQSRVSRFFGNLDLPATAANQTLQGHPVHALQSLGRFAVNSTVGIGGMLDPATRFGIPACHEEDFGQTLATWGWRDSRYLVMPLLGPRTVRDAVAVVGDQTLSPLGYIEDRGAANALQLLQLVDGRARLLSMDQDRREAYDEYALVRDAWMQRRRYQIERNLHSGEH